MTDGQSFVSKKEKIYYNNIYNKGLSKILKFSNKLRTILDIGCSSGIFLDLAKKKNLITYGVELNKKELKLVSSKHVIFSKNIFDFHYDRKFDCITMWDVIEHIKDTNLLLKRIYNMLSPNGIFFFQTPNAFSAASTILNKNCNMFDGIEHVNLFSLKNIHLIAKKNNFKILSIETIISEIPIINNYLEFKDIYLGDSRKSKLFQIIDEKKLHKNLLGYKFQVVFKKS
jgi:2-polyprenyl-3-methyl-5-hydroxy-6-metoxy-1,4-benzoquinol methylase